MDVTPKQRLFFALWPPQTVRSELALLLDDVLADQRGRRVPTSNLHVTLAFLGAIDGDTRRCTEKAAAGTRAAPFELVLDHLHYLARAHLLWLGASETPAELARLADGLSASLSACGIAQEHRAFRPHMTLMRDTKARQVPKIVNPLRWPIADFALVESRTLPAGAEYTVLETFKLTA